MSKILRQEPEILTWNVKNVGDLTNWTSKSFEVVGTKHEFYFVIYPLSKEEGHMFLQQRCRDSSKCFDLHIELKFLRGVKKFSWKNVNDTRDLGTIQANDLLNIRCKFSCIRNCTEEIHEISEELTDDMKKEMSGVVEQKDILLNEDLKNPEKIKGILRLSKDFEEMFLDKEFSDVVVKVGNEEFHANKYILAARSSVFRAMMKNDMQEKGVINIPDSDPQVFKRFLLYLYSGKLSEISSGSVCQLYYVADKYDTKDLKTICVNFIKNNVCSDIICDVISLARRYSDDELLNFATDFFMFKAKEIIETVSWKNFVKENPEIASELFRKTLKFFT